jgi:hypothetical protein
MIGLSACLSYRDQTSKQAVPSVQHKRRKLPNQSHHPNLNRQSFFLMRNFFLILAYLISAAAWVTVMINPASDPRHEDVYAFFPLLVMAIGFTFLTDLLSYLKGKWYSPNSVDI